MPSHPQSQPGRTQHQTADRAATGVFDADTARALAEHLLDPSRQRPVVVVSVPVGRLEPYVDVEEVLTAVGNLAEVYVLSTGPASFAFSDALPERTQVYGGASRVYPIDDAWLENPSRSPLRFAYGTGDRQRATTEIVSDALTMAHAAGLTGAPAVTAQSFPAAGVVLGVVGGRALAKVSGGGVMPALIWPELIVDGVRAEQLFQKGMAVAGVYDAGQNRLDVAQMRLPVAEALANYTCGTAVLARVGHVERSLCVLELLPEVQVSLDADAAGQQGDDLRTVLSVGEVVTAIVVTAGTGEDDFALTLSGTAAQTPVPAAVLLSGGPPWLELPAPPTFDDVDDDGDDGDGALAAAAEDQPATLTTAVAATEDATVVALRHERDQLLAELQRTQARLDRGGRQAVAARTELRLTRERAIAAEREREELKARLASRTVVASETLFADRLEQLKFDVFVTWAYRTQPGEKATLPLTRWSVGDHFFSSWDQVQGVDAAKVVEVVVDVLTGRADQMPGRAMHQLRAGGGGDDPPVVRADGATCWRVYLQQRTASARRLHFWRLNDGSVELSSIRLHDNMEP